MTAATRSLGISSTPNTPRGTAGVREQLADRQRAAADVGGVLEHRAVARAQARRGEAEHLPQREVPRHPGEHGAERLERDEAARAVARERLVGEELGGMLREPGARERALLHLGAGLRQGLAHLGGDQRGERVAALEEQLADPRDQRAALGDGGRPPLRVRVPRRRRAAASTSRSECTG